MDRFSNVLVNLGFKGPLTDFNVVTKCVPCDKELVLGEIYCRNKGKRLEYVCPDCKGIVAFTERVGKGISYGSDGGYGVNVGLPGAPSLKDLENREGGGPAGQSTPPAG